MPLCVLPSVAEPQPPLPDSEFQKVVIDATPGEPMDLAVLPDGRILHAERSGEVWLPDPDMQFGTPASSAAVLRRAAASAVDASVSAADSRTTAADDAQ